MEVVICLAVKNFYFSPKEKNNFSLIELHLPGQNISKFILIIYMLFGGNLCNILYTIFCTVGSYTFVCPTTDTSIYVD